MGGLPQKITAKTPKMPGKSSKKASGEETFPVGFLGRFAGCPKKSSQKKRGGYTVLDPYRQLVPARLRHPKKEIETNLPTSNIHLQVLFVFSFRERFSAHNLVETFPTKMLLPCTEIMPHAIDGASMFIACLSRLKSQSQVKKRSVPFPAVGPGGPPKKEPELVGVDPHI